MVSQRYQYMVVIYVLRQPVMPSLVSRHTGQPERSATDVMSDRDQISRMMWITAATGLVSSFQCPRWCDSALKYISPPSRHVESKLGPLSLLSGRVYCAQSRFIICSVSPAGFNRRSSSAAVPVRHGVASVFQSHRQAFCPSIVPAVVLHVWQP